MTGSAGKKSMAKKTADEDVAPAPEPYLLSIGERLVCLERLAMALGAAHTMREVADVIITEGLSALGGNAGSVALITPDAQEFITIRCSGYPPEVVERYSRYPYETSLPTADAARQSEAIFIETRAERDKRYPHLAGSGLQGGRGAFVALPLLVNNRTLGGFGLSFPDDRAFHDDDRGFLQTIGQLCAQALDRARLYDEAQMEIAERERVESALRESEEQLRASLNREHQVAATLQRSLLKMPPDGAFPGLVISSRYESATSDLEVGGDFLDAFQIASSQVALVVGDVSGKGLAAAASTSEIKYTLRTLLREYEDPSIAVNRLNTHLFDSGVFENTPGGFLALCLAVIDSRTGRARFALGGIEPPLIARATGKVDQVGAQGLPVGILPDAYYDQPTETLEEGDLLVIVTDGITEARRDGECFGYEGLTSAVAPLRDLPSLGQIAQSILDAARNFGGGDLRDDTAILLARLTSP